MEPLVSIIVPVYNVASYLREALDSVIHQTYQNLEIIIVDDGSTDESGEICDEYITDLRVQVIHQENKGLSGARNTGLDRISGEYVVFLDSDDAFYPEMIENLLAVLLRNKVELAACSFGLYRTEGCLAEAVKEKIVGFQEERIYSAREAITGQMEGCFDEAAWNKIYKYNLWKNLRFPVGYVYEDMRVMPLLYEKAERIAVTPRELAYRRIRAGSITGSRTVRNMQDLLDAYRVLQDYVDQANPTYPEKSVRIMRGRMMQTLTTRWTEMGKQGASPSEISEVRKEILQFFEEKTDFCQFRQNAVWWLFSNCPGMLRPVRNCYQGVRGLLGRGKTG